MTLSIALVIPVFNGGAAFARCLEGIRALDPPADELLVVDDGSTDGSAELARRAGARVLTMPKRSGPAAARNLGARSTQAELLLFLDADVVPRPELIASMRAVFTEDPGLSAAFGSYDDEPDATSFISQYKNLFHHFTHQLSPPDASTFWSGCGAILRASFLQLGGFEESYARPCIEDIELGYRLRAARERIGLRRDIQVKHLKRWTLWNQVSTDLLDRAVPWTELLLRRGAIDTDLNLGWSSRINVALGCLALALLALSPWAPNALWIAAALLAVQLAGDLPLFSFFRSRRGTWFALRALLWHRHYYWICGLGFATGAWRHLLCVRPASSRQFIEPAGPR